MKRDRLGLGLGFQRRTRIVEESVADGCMVCAVPNVRAEAGPTAKRQARDADNSLRRFAGLAF